MFDRSIPMIGFHTLLDTHEGVEPLIRLIREGLVPANVNTIVLEMRSQFRCFPEYSMGTVTFEDARSIADVCAEYGIRLVPLLPCLSHQSTHERSIPYPIYQAHPEFLESPEEANTGKQWPDFTLHSWCASNDDIYQYIFPMMDEMAEACRAEAVHVGLDELFEIAKCPRCKGKDPAKLYARTVKILHDHLAEKGLSTMIWGDRLLPSLEMGYTLWEGDRFDIHQAIDMPEITKDLIICDWHYDIHSHGYPSIEYFMTRGFFVVPSVWINNESAKHFFLHAQEGVYLGRTYGWPGTMGGILYTHWIPMDETHAQQILNGIAGETPEAKDASTEVGRVIARLTKAASNVKV